MQMKISIVTVAYNEEKNISRTIESVLGQTSDDYEYIICDGKSQDSTVDIARSYAEKFAEKGIDYAVYSEKDNGIYDAMNKGIDLASGDYIIFMNSGDWFYSNDVIDNTIRMATDNGCPQVIYGDVASVQRSVANIIKGDHNSLEKCMSICHQAIFVSVPLIKKIKFDIRYKIAADYNLMLDLKKQEIDFYHMDVVVAYFSGDGVSTTQIEKLHTECADIKEAHGIYVDRKEVKKSIRKGKIKQKIKNIMPKKLWICWNVNRKNGIVLKEECYNLS